MEITSLALITLVIIALFVFYLIPGKLRSIYLVVISGLFIASYSLVLLAYVFGYGLLNFVFGLLLSRTKFKKTVFGTGVAFNLLQLAVLRYHPFLIDPFFTIVNINFSLSLLTNIIVPLGISFYTLQGIGYLINISKGWEKPETRLFDFLLYIMFFPKFLSGPIEQSNKFLPQLKTNIPFQENQVTDGLRIALFGFFKKIVIANQLGQVVNATYSGVESTSGYTLWLVLLLQPFYLYFDFSGYTDIAIGFAKAFGIKLSPNFDRPFLAENVSTFWRRFHMSLTNWFNDYIFRQLSFKYRRWGIYAPVFAVFITFTLFGIWHGAGWNFMVLGFIQALAINYEFFTKKYRVQYFSKIREKYRAWFGRIITYCFYGGSLVFFFSPSLKSAISYFKQLFNHSVPMEFNFTKSLLLAFILILVFMFFELLSNDYKEKYGKMLVFISQKKWLRLVVYYIMIVLIIKFLGGNEVFIYQMF